jgi:hypothetical protein
LSLKVRISWFQAFLLSNSQLVPLHLGKMLTVNWRMRSLAKDHVDVRHFSLRDDYLLLRTRHCGGAVQVESS